MEKEQKKASGAAKASIGFGAALAIVMSWTANKAFIWVLIHGVLGWIYVVYYLLFKGGWTWL